MATVSGASPKLGRLPVCGEVVGQLTVPVTEHRPQRAAGTGVSTRSITRSGRRPTSSKSWVWRQRTASFGRQRRQAVGADGVDETPRRVVAVGLVVGDPAQTARQAEFGAPVLQRVGLGDQPHRLPRRREPGERAGPGMPVEHLVDRCVDHARILKPHWPTVPAIAAGRSATDPAARARRWAAAAAVARSPRLAARYTCAVSSATVCQSKSDGQPFPGGDGAALRGGRIVEHGADRRGQPAPRRVADTTSRSAPLITASPRPPTFDVTSGVPAAAASSATMPNGS